MPSQTACTVGSLLDEGRRRLAEAGVQTPGLDAQVLLAEAAGWSRAALFARSRDGVPPGVAEMFRRSVERRAAREPVARILGRREFFGLVFRVAPCVLVPRPETEMLVALGLERLRTMGESAQLLDVGTGSGCVAVSLAHSALREGLKVDITALDVSPGAVDVARSNAEEHGVSGVVAFEAADALDPGWRPAGAPFHLLVSNPPYVASGDIAGLEPEVSRWDPPEALDGGPDGLSFIRGLLKRVPALVRPGGAVLLEVGARQAPAVLRLAAEEGLEARGAHRDLAGIERVVELVRP